MAVTMCKICQSAEKWITDVEIEPDNYAVNPCFKQVYRAREYAPNPKKLDKTITIACGNFTHIRSGRITS